MHEIWPSHSYDYSRITHPNLTYELQPLKPYGLALVAVFVTLNGGAIYAVWTRRNSSLTKSGVYTHCLWELSFDARPWARQRTPALGGARVQPL